MENLNQNIDTAVNNASEGTTEVNKAVTSFSQDDVDRIVSERVEREKKKTKEQKAEVKRLSNELQSLNELRKVLAGSTEAGESLEKQVEYLKEYYGYSEKEAKNFISDEGKEAIAIVNAQKFLKESDDDDIVDTMQELAEKKSLTAEEKILQEEITERYNKIIFGRDLKTVEKWWNENCEGELKEIVASEDFIDFVDGLNEKPSILIKKFAKYSGKIKAADNKKDDKPASERKSAGSVKDSSGGGNGVDYFTREEVEKMSREEVRKNLSIIEKSMKKWR